MLNYREQVRKRFPNLGEVAVQHRVKQMQDIDALHNEELLTRVPRPFDAPELLCYGKIPSPMSFMTYGEIAAYYWALDNAEPFGKFFARRGLGIHERPGNYKDHILPQWTTPYVWDAMRRAKCVTFKDMFKPVHVRRTTPRLPPALQVECTQRGYKLCTTKMSLGYDLYIAERADTATRELYVKIGQRVSALRHHDCKTLEDVAKGAGGGITVGNLQLLEAGLIRTLTLEQIMALVTYFNVSPNYLLGW